MFKFQGNTQHSMMNCQGKGRRMKNRKTMPWIRERINLADPAPNTQHPPIAIGRVLSVALGLED
jgi:hypothetical protein